MNRRRTFALALLALPAFTGCRWVAVEGVPVTFDRAPGDIVDLQMIDGTIPRTFQSDEYGTGTPLERCQWMGGRFEVDADGVVWCRGVDG